MIGRLPHLASKPVSATARRALTLGGLGLLLAGLPGCQSIDVNAPTVAQVRFINASSDSSGFDFYANSSALAYNVGFGYITSYIAESPGTYTLAADTPNTRQTLVAANAGLANGHQYTALVSNISASLQETVYVDQSQPAPSGQISVRVLDEATRVGAVDVYLVPSNGKLSTTSPFVTNLSFGSSSGYLAIPASTYAIAVVPTGTVPVSTTVTLLTGAQIGYASGSVRTIVLIDQQLVTSPGVQAIVASDYDSPNS